MNMPATPAEPTWFRICPATGRRIDLGAQRLIKVHAVASIVSLLIGAIAAVLLVLTRWQAVHLLPAVWFYRILGVHGMSMLIFFIIFFEMAVLIFASTVLLRGGPIRSSTSASSCLPSARSSRWACSSPTSSWRSANAPTRGRCRWWSTAR